MHIENTFLIDRNLCTPIGHIMPLVGLPDVIRFSLRNYVLLKPILGQILYGFKLFLQFCNYCWIETQNEYLNFGILKCEYYKFRMLSF